MTITTTEKSVLRQLHFNGFINWGSMSKSKRVPFLESLIDKGLLYKSTLKLTKKGKELSR